MLSVHCLKKSYPGFILEVERFEVPGGTIMGLVGENGAGKTTLIRCITNLIRDYTGEVLIDGVKYTARERSLVAKVGYMSEEVDLIAELTPSEHLQIAKAISPRWDDEVAAHLLSKWSLNPTKTVKELSRGNKVKLGLIIAFARCPEVLILDEPTSGLDPVMREQVLCELRRFRHDHKCSVLISSHILDDLCGTTDSVAVVKNGKIVSIEHNDGIGQAVLRKRILGLLESPSEEVPC